MNRLTLPLAIIAVGVLTGCSVNTVQTVPSETIRREIRSYKVAKDTQVQLIASDMAVELGVDGVEWNNHLKPWSYKTFRTRTISLDRLDKQEAYIALFADTGLLPRYDVETNRIFVEPFSTQIKQTYNFEPAFTFAAKEATKLLNKDKLAKLNNGETQEFLLYQNETLQDSLNAWGKEAGYDSIIWYIKDPKQIDLITKKNRATVTIVERSPLFAINAILENINNSKMAPLINMRVDSGTHSLVFHGLSKKEPFKVFKVEATSTKAVLEKLAKSYGSQIQYNAPDYMITEEYKTVITNRIQLTLEEIVAGYPLNVKYDESTNKIKVTPQ